MTIDEALEYFLGAQVRLPSEASRAHMLELLSEAGREAAKRRQEGPEATRVILAAMVEQGMSYRDIEEATGIRKSTAERLVARHRT